MDLVVTARSRASDRAVLLELRAAPGHSLPGYTTGAHSDVLLGPNRDRPRSYSLLGRGSDAPDRFEICIQRGHGDETVSAATWAGDHVQVGDVLSVADPRDTFHFPAAPTRAVLLAGGIGVTPLIAIADDLHERGIPFDLVCWSTRVEDMPLLQRLRGSAYAASVTVLGTDHDGSPRTAPPPPQLNAPSVTAAVAICGPAGFIETMQEHAIAAGWEPDRIAVERFVADAGATTPAPADTVFQVVAASDGRSFDVPVGTSILDVLTAAGYDIDSSCRKGTCGTCLTDVLEGIPDHRDIAQSDAEHAANDLITVCCSRSLTPRLVLDV